MHCSVYNLCIHSVQGWTCITIIYTCSLFGCNLITFKLLQYAHGAKVVWSFHVWTAGYGWFASIFHSLDSSERIYEMDLVLKWNQWSTICNSRVLGWEWKVYPPSFLADDVINERNSAQILQKQLLDAHEPNLLDEDGKSSAELTDCSYPFQIVTSSSPDGTAF
jgi:hypothetical protein